MSAQLLKSVGVCVLLLAAGVLFSTHVQAHGGLAMAQGICKLTIGPYHMHFTGYQPDSIHNKEFCEDIPATGRTVVALDYLEDALGALPVEIWVIRDTDSEQDHHGITVLHLPPKIYPNGTVYFEHSFDQPGKFVGLVTVGGKQEHVSLVPFSVGASKMSSRNIMAPLEAIAGGATILMAPLGALAGGTAILSSLCGRRKALCSTVS
jgi:hypothetical protein